MTTTTEAAGILPRQIAEFTDVEGEILAQLGVSQATIVRFGHLWEERCLPLLLGPAEAADLAALDADLAALDTDLAALGLAASVRGIFDAYRGEVARLNALVAQVSADRDQALAGEQRASQAMAALRDEIAGRVGVLARDLAALERKLGGDAPPASTEEKQA